MCADEPQALSRADTRARATAYTLLPVDTSREFEVYGPLGAGICTAPAVDTLPGRKGDLCPWVLGLRAVTEDTPEGTSLEEDHTADAGAILKAVPFDINDEGELAHLCNTEPMAEVPGHKTKLVDVVQISIQLNLVFKQ